MKKPILKQHRLLLILLLLLSCMMLFAACKEEPTGSVIKAVALDEKSKPQTVYAEGQELNMSKGSLVVTYEDGTKETVALNAEGVSVTGYDKNKLGDQPLTITYCGKSVSLTVTVAKRMTFSNYKTEYFVGDDFDVAKGKVTVLRNDGTRVDTRLNDSTISVVSFDSSTAGKGKLVTIRYSANGEEYTDTVAVNVYNVGSVKFVKPSKVSYGSHNTELNLQGGYLLVTAEGNEELTQPVPLEQNMVSGFDPSAATRDNIEDPLIQTITVTYGGQTYEYTISLRYSGVTMMQEASKLLADIVVEPDKMAIEEAEGIAAIEALQEYMKMTPAERAYLAEEDAHRVARVGAIYSAAYSNKLAERYSKALVMQNGGISIAKDSTYQSVAEVIELLSDPENEFIKFVGFMAEFVEEFADVKLYEEYTIGENIGYVRKDSVMYSVTVLQFMLKLSDDLAEVPDNWTVDSLPAYADAIDAAAMHIRTFSDQRLIAHICNIVSNWRTNNDYLDIIYSFYYHHQRSLIIEELWNQVPLPGKLQEMYVQIISAANIAQTLAKQGKQALWSDTTYFFLYFDKAVELANEIQSGDNQLYKDLYEFIDMDEVMDAYLRYSTVGFLNLAKSLYGDEQYSALLDSYIGLISKAVENSGSLDVEENKDTFQGIFDQFVNMTPAKQRAFLSSIYYLYGVEKVRDSVLMDYSAGQPRGMFVYLLISYFHHYLPESTQPMLQDLLLAMEYYLNSNLYDNAMDNFLAKMEGLNTAYEALSASDKAVFDQYLGAAYQKYQRLYKINKNGPTVDKSQYEAMFNELVDAIADFSTMYSKLADAETGKLNPGMVAAAVGAYERARTIAEQILASENEEILALFSTLEINLTEEVKLPLDYAFLNLRWNYLVMMHNVTYTYTIDDVAVPYYAWELYSSEVLGDLMAKTFYVMNQQFAGATEFDTAKVLDAMKAFRQQLSENPKSLSAFYTFDGDYYYYDGLRSFFGKVLTEGNAALGSKLLEVEQLYTEYAVGGGDEEKAAFLNAMAEVIALYASITDTENYNTYLAEMYNFYLDLYNALNSAA